MADKTKIEWATATWSPITGCTPVSAACDHCYAARMIGRGLPKMGHKGPFSSVQFHPSRLDQPLRWKKPRRIFVCSMGDIWHPRVEPIHRALIFDRIRKCSQHTFVLLTKRANEMFEDVTDNSMIYSFFPLPNVIGMVTVENQEMADLRIPYLLKTPFSRHGVSVEPMLGPVDLRPFLPHEFNREPHCPWCEDCIPNHGDWDGWKETREGKHGPFLDWVICGGESGPGARPMHPDWPRSLRDQCQAAGVPFFFKQWGEWAPVQAYCGPASKRHKWSCPAGTEPLMARVGKKAAGCLLDGREWKEIPA